MNQNGNKQNNNKTNNGMNLTWDGGQGMVKGIMGFEVESK